MDWRDAREATGMTMDSALLAWDRRKMPASIKAELNRSKLQRLEAGKVVRLSVVALANLAAIYDIPLSMVDETAAKEYRAVTDPASRIATCDNATSRRTVRAA